LGLEAVAAVSKGARIEPGEGREGRAGELAHGQEKAEMEGLPRTRPEQQQRQRQQQQQQEEEQTAVRELGAAQALPRMRAKMQGRVRIRRLKEFASERLPGGSTLRDLILAEEDELAPEEFLAKMDLWLKMFRREFLRCQAEGIGT
jgi:hypothetical protein